MSGQHTLEILSRCLVWRQTHIRQVELVPVDRQLLHQQGIVPDHRVDDSLVRGQEVQQGGLVLGCQPLGKEPSCAGAKWVRKVDAACVLTPSHEGFKGKVYLDSLHRVRVNVPPLFPLRVEGGLHIDVACVLVSDNLGQDVDLVKGVGHR